VRSVLVCLDPLMAWFLIKHDGSFNFTLVNSLVDRPERIVFILTC
jgi:hypothetical protein